MDIENIELVKSLYEEAKAKYSESSKPANYIPGHIKRRVPFEISNSEIYDIVFGVSEDDKKCPVCGQAMRNFAGFGAGYTDTCSRKCARNTPQYSAWVQEHWKKRREGGYISPLRGLTYAEIHGEGQHPCGYQPGEANVAKRPDIRRKISEGVSRSYQNPALIKMRREAMIDRIRRGKVVTWCKYYNAERDEYYHSQFEKAFAQILSDEGLEYVKDYPLVLTSTRTKLVDFVLEERGLYIELSGFAYDRWKNDFIEKLHLMDKVLVNKTLLLFTYTHNVEELRDRTRDMKGEVIVRSFDSMKEELRKCIR